MGNAGVDKNNCKGGEHASETCLENCNCDSRLMRYPLVGNGASGGEGHFGFVSAQRTKEQWIQSAIVVALPTVELRPARATRKVFFSCCALCNSI